MQQNVFTQIMKGKILFQLYNTISFIGCDCWYNGEILGRGGRVEIILFGGERLTLCAEYETQLPDYDNPTPGGMGDFDAVNTIAQECGQKLAKELLTIHHLPWKAFAANIIGGKLIYGVAT